MLTINCDLGEWETPTQTAALMKHIHLANIACGGHAGSPETIAHCRDLAHRNNVKTGAHPGVPGNKGRTLPTNFTTHEFTDLLHRQLETYLATNTPLHHIKLHGALYHLSENNPEIQRAYIEIATSHKTPIVCLANGNLHQTCSETNTPHIPEAFLDRNYLPNGQLVPRTQPDAYLTDLTKIQTRIQNYQESQTTPLTLCIHSDTENAPEIARTARQQLTP